MDRRTYPRADAYVALGVRLLSRQSQPAYFSKIAGEAAAADIAMRDSEGDEQYPEFLPEFMDELREKAAAVVKVLDSAEDVDGFQELEYRQVNLSGSGIRFLCDDKCNVKDLVELRMLLPIDPPRANTYLRRGCQSAGV